MTSTRRRLVVVALAAALLSVHAMPAQAHEVRYGTSGGLGGNVFYNVTISGQTYCAKGSGWMNHPGSGGTRARSSVTTWFRRGSSPSACAGSSSVPAPVDDYCFGLVSTAIFRNGSLEAYGETWGSGVGRSSLTATVPAAGYSAGSYQMYGYHYWNTAWPGSCQGSPNAGGNWGVSHNL